MRRSPGSPAALAQRILAGIEQHRSGAEHGNNEGLVPLSARCAGKSSGVGVHFGINGAHFCQTPRHSATLLTTLKEAPQTFAVGNITTDACQELLHAPRSQWE